jgi:hypothetical protein
MLNKARPRDLHGHPGGGREGVHALVGRLSQEEKRAL